MDGANPLRLLTDFLAVPSTNLFDFFMSDHGTIIIHGTGTLCPEMREAILAAQNQGVEIIYAHEPTPDHIVILNAAPPMPEINLAALKLTHAERATPNQPWYAKFQKKRRRKF